MGPDEILWEAGIRKVKSRGWAALRDAHNPVCYTGLNQITLPDHAVSQCLQGSCLADERARVP